MKRYFLLSAITALLIFSCSSDKENDMLDENSIVGTWRFTGLNIANASSSNDIKLANDVIKLLILQECEILTFNFKSDKTVIADYRDFTQTGRDVKPDGSGLLIKCPDTVETDTSTWSLKGDQLTFIDKNGAEETVTIKFNGATLTIPAEVVNEDNLQGAEAIFERK